MVTGEDMETYLAIDTLVEFCPFSASKLTQPADRFMDNARHGVSMRKNRDSPTPGQLGYPSSR
jgi:hypothetical protein